jgi:hypothetical protein
MLITGGSGARHLDLHVFVLERICRQASTTRFSNAREAANVTKLGHRGPINIKAAWRKADDYYTKLDDSPAYYAAVCLHPYYKYYCDNSWRTKAGWLNAANAGFQQLWAEYKPPEPPQRRPKASTLSSIYEAINAHVEVSSSDVNSLDEFDCWKKYEPKWTEEQYMEEGNPVKYWIKLLPKYPNLARFAIDIMTIPASSCDCERMFSELGDFLEPRRRAIGPELLAAMQFIRPWSRAGFQLPPDGSDTAVTDEQLVREYRLCNWQHLAN